MIKLKEKQGKIMRYIFGKVAQQPADTHPFTYTIYLKNSQNGWQDGTLKIDTAEEWIEIIRRRLLLLGITNALYETNTPDKENDEACRFTFYFTNAFQYFQFQAAVAENTQGTFKRRIEAPSERESAYQLKKMSHFLEEHGIEHDLFRLDDKTIIVATTQRQDDLIVAMQVANKSFNLAPKITSSKTKAALLLPANERAV
jgi:hypothetical protein